jgi:type IV pilus assembly protein PilW
VALVARSPQRDAEPVTEDGATTCAVARPPVAAVCWKPDPAGTGEQIDVSAGMSGDEWRHYRYQVLETTIPLRNAIWQQ